MYFVHVRYHARNAGVKAGVRYISHREEGLPRGRTRTLYGIGERYRALRGDERGLTKLLWEDGEGLKSPRYFRIKLTVDDVAARELSRLSAAGRERALRDAVTRTFRGALRMAQGVFVIHEHGGKKRPFGHPHVHVHLGPRLANGQPIIRIAPVRLHSLKERWEREVKEQTRRAIEREDRGPARALRGLMAQRRPRRSKEKPSVLRLVRKGLATLYRWRARGPARELSVGLDAGVSARRLLARTGGNPSQTLAREVLRRLVRSLPDRSWAGLEAVRLIGRVIPR